MPRHLYLKVSICLVLIMGLAWLAPHPIIGGIIGMMGSMVIRRVVDADIAGE